MATTNDLTAIKNYAGTYENTIITSVVNGLDIAQDVTVIRNLRAPKNLPKYKGNKGFQPLNTNKTKASGQHGKFTNRKLIPRVGMKLYSVIPEELRDTYLSEQLAANAKDYPGGFAQYFWDEQVKVLQAEINDNSYDSVNSEDIDPYDAGATYAVGNRILFTDENYYKCIVTTTAGQSPTSHPAKWEDCNGSSVAKGFGTIISEVYSSLPTANKIATGTISSTNAYDKVLAFYMAIPEAVQKLGGVVHVSHNVFQDYMLHVQNKFTSGTSFLDVEGELAGYIYSSGKKWKIKSCSWMNASRRLIGTRKENLFMGTDLTSDFNTLGKMVETVHGYDAIMKMILSFEIGDLDLLFVNDQA